MPYFNKSDIPKHLKCYTRTCAWCSTTFYSPQPKAQYCRTTCRVYAFQKRNPEGFSKRQPLNKKDLEQQIDLLETTLEQSFQFRSKEQYKKTKRQLNLLKSHLTIEAPELDNIHEDDLLYVLLKNISFNKNFFKSLIKDLKK